jgi:hypothetical protein
MPLRHRGQGIAPLILNLSTVSNIVVNVMFLPLQIWYPLTRSVGRFMASLDVLENRKISSLPGFKIQVAQLVA